MLWTRTLTVALLALLAAACSPRQGKVLHASPHAATEGAPFVLELAGAEDIGGERVLTASLTLIRPLAAPMVLSVDLPANAWLSEGLQRETITRPQPGVLTRTFRIRGEPGPITVEAAQRLADVAGARARRTYPPPHQAPPSRMAPTRPARFGNIIINRAIIRPEREGGR